MFTTGSFSCLHHTRLAGRVGVRVLAVSASVTKIVNTLIVFKMNFN